MRLGVILLPGIITPAEVAYVELRAALGGGVTVLPKELAIYDGRSPPPDYGLDDEIGAVLTLAVRHGFDRFHLCGYSAGGAIAAALAAAHPEKLASLALMEPAWFGNEGLGEDETRVRDEIEAAMRLPPQWALPAFTRANLAAGVTPPPPPPGPPPGWMSTRPAAIRGMMAAFGNHRLDMDALRRFDRPVLFVRGGLSNPAIWEGMEARARTVFPDFRSETFGNRHHFDPPHRTEPRRLAALLSEFWERAEATADGTAA